MLDSIDQKIIDILLEDSRITNIEIAGKIKRSESTVRQRITKLTNNGIIKSFSITVDPKAIGYKTIAFIGINVNPSKLLKVVKTLRKIDGIMSIATTTGAYMIFCQVWCINSVKLTEIVDKIEEIDGILEIMPTIIQEFIKE